ncbi:MAG: chitobiase/beta-hexosaminidase C-terminal domain-containing protein [Eubacteriaceae bacterium]
MWGTVVGTGITSMDLPIHATDGSKRQDAELSHTDKTSASSTFGSQTIYTNGWNGTDLLKDEYWQIKFSTKGIEAPMVLSAKTYGTATSPADFKLVYSTDAITFKEVPNSSYVNTTTASTLTSEPNVKVTLPDEIKDKDQVIIRFLQASTLAINGSTVQSGGNSRISFITIKTNDGKEKCAAPEANPGTGNITGTTLVSLSTTTPGGIIHYTVDGTEPSATNGIIFNSPIAIANTTTLKAITIAEGYNDSNVGTFYYTLTTQAVAPVANPGSGAVKFPITIDLSTTLGETIYYTTDGTEPTIASSAYNINNKIVLTEPRTIKAIAVKDGISNSPIATFEYTQLVETPIEIREARRKALNEEVFFKGVITGISGSSVYLQDETAGIVLNINATTLSEFGATIGNEVQVRGNIAAPYNGLLQVKVSSKNVDPNAIVVLSNPGLPTPALVTISMVNSGNYEAMLVKILGGELVSKNATPGTQNHTLSQQGASCIFRANIEGFNQGDQLEIVGLASVFNSPQILQPLAQADSGISLYAGSGETIGDPVDVVLWSYAAASSSPIPATEGINKESGELTTNATGALGYANSGINVGGWNDGANAKYWNAKFSTKGAANLTVTSSHRSSGTGPRDFKLQYSLNGIEYKDVVNGAFVIPNALPLSALVNKVALPLEVNNQETVYLRWLLTSNTSAAAGTIASGGTSTINYVTVAGAEYYGPDDVAPVKATPNSGVPVPMGTEVTLTSATADTIIYYTMDGSEPTNASRFVEGPIRMDTLPLSIKAFAESKNDSNKKSIVKTFNYTQAKLDLVQANKLSGSSLSPSLDRVVLSSQQNATIRYIVTKKSGEIGETTDPEATYTQPLSFVTEDYPIKISARAEKDGYIPSDGTIFEYTAKREGGEKNYFGQIHSHTAENSDGAGTLVEAYAWAKDVANLDFFAVTDHSNSFDTAPSSDKPDVYNLFNYNADNTKWQNGINAAKNAMSEDFISFYGYEMTWSGGPGHINTFNTTGFVSRNNAILNSKPNDAGLRAYYDLLKATPNSISQFNHPGPTFGDFGGFGYYDPIIDQRISLLEVGNGEGTIGSGGYFPSYNEYNKALDKGWHLAPTNNQDNHKKHWGSSNTARTVIHTNDLSVEGVYEALRDMRVYATEDNKLDITYTLNGYPLGSILDEIPETATLKAKLATENPEKIATVSVISNGGESIYSQNFSSSEVDFEQMIQSPVPGYYYIKVVEESGKIAVTAPVWLGKAASVGITEVKSSTNMPVTTEELTLSTEFFNNEDNSVNINTIKYEVLEGEVISEDLNLNKNLGSQSNFVHEQKFTPTTAGSITIQVSAEINVNGENKTYVSHVVLDVRDLENLDYIGIDASHFNEYVDGNYKASMGNFGKLAAEYNARTVELKTSEDLLAALENPKFKMMVLTAPSRRNGTTGRLPYAIYSDAEINAIGEFAKAGHTVVISGWSDFYENYANLEGTPLDEMMAGQQNKLLQAIGSNLRISDDGVLDDINNGGTSPRLYLTDYNNFVSPLTQGIVDGQVYSHYGGSTIYAVNPDNTPAMTLPESVLPIISGHETTYSIDQDNDGFGLPEKATTVPKYNDRVLLTASETVDHGNGVTSLVVASGAAFMSDFEIQATVENAGTLNYSNYNILSNIIEGISPAVISNIADVKNAAEGTEFTVEGVATSNVYDGGDNNKGFFDSIYIQDSSDGINLFPVSGGVAEGQKVQVTGKISSYQGEIQLLVSKIKVIDSSITHVLPTEINTVALGENTGKLLKLTGTVIDIKKEEDGVISQITIDDGSGPSIVYINGYITKTVDLDFVKLGAKISAIGLGSIGENFTSSDMLPRLRVRDRGEITLVEREISLTGISLNKTKLTLELGEEETLVPQFQPENTTDLKGVTWTSSDTNIVGVDGNGKVTGLNPGTATITATSVVNPEIKGTCEVKVNPIKLESISLSRTALTLIKEDSSHLNVIYHPTNAFVTESVLWTSSDPSIATVDNDGNVKAIEKGTTTITATIEGKTATCKVNVQDIQFVTIRGQIIGQDGKPLGLTTLELHSTPMRTKTDANGYFVFENVPFGKHTLYVLGEDGKILGSMEINVIQGKDNHFEITTGDLTIKEGEKEVTVKVQMGTNEKLTIVEVRSGNVVFDENKLGNTGANGNANPSKGSGINPKTGGTILGGTAILLGILGLGLGGFLINKKKREA